MEQSDGPVKGLFLLIAGGCEVNRANLLFADFVMVALISPDGQEE
jgi:hypothetical protein